MLRVFAEHHIEEAPEIPPKHYENALFFGCVFGDLRGLTLKDCDLNGSKFTTDEVKKALGFTLSLNCHSFKGVEYSPLLFDMMLFLLSQTKGNNEKREELKKLLGDKYEAFSRLFEVTE